MKMTMPMTTSLLIIAAMIVSSTSLFVVVVEAFQPVVTSGIIQQQRQSRRIRSPSFIPTTQKSRTRSNVIMYRIRCENKYYQLEELEDAENCTTELFLKENGDVEMGDTDGPLYTIATGKWEMINNQFAMSITKTYQTGNENKDVGVFTFDVERQFMGEMTVVGGTEVAVNGKIYAEDIITNKLDKEVGFFNMIDGTDVRLERRDDAVPTKDIGVGIEPSPIESKDVVGHEGIPKEWGITATELKLASEQVTGGSSSSNNEQQQVQQPAVGMETTYGQQQQQDYDAAGVGGGYGQQQPSPVQEGIPEYGGGNFGQQAQDYGGSGVSSGQHPQQQQQGNEYGYSSYDQQQQQQQGGGGGLPEFGAGNFGQASQGFGGGGGSGVDSSSSYGAGYGQQQQQSPGGYGYGQPPQQQQQQQPNDPGPPSFSDYNYGQQQQQTQQQQQQSSTTNNNAGPPSFSDYNYGQPQQQEQQPAQEQQPPQQGYDPQQQQPQQSQGYWANDGTYYPNDSGGDEEVEVEEQTGEYDGSNYGDSQQQQGQS